MLTCSPGLAATIFLLSAAMLAGNAAAETDLPELDCLIEPEMTVELASAADGIIDKMLVDTSDMVEAGQPLAELESSVEEATLEVARARAAMDETIRSRQVALGFAQRKLKRVTELFARQAVSAFERDEAETEVKLAGLELTQAREEKRLAELEHRQARAAYERRVVRSPVTGVVVERYLAPGETVEDRPIFRLAQINPLRVEVIAPTGYFGNVEPGMRALVVPEAPLDQGYVAEVTMVDRVIDAASGTFGIRLTLPNNDFTLPGGLKCKLKLLPADAEQVDLEALAADLRVDKPRALPN
ncbi:MAG: efflux RND transporter periplasmic adaptor subunit [Gammaproteobacteria bacterium]|nr:efflux RND transporter periplasmic adaptor subunit [Gammaproteobacteria bacterium]